MSAKRPRSTPKQDGDGASKRQRRFKSEEAKAEYELIATLSACLQKKDGATAEQALTAALASGLKVRPRIYNMMMSLYAETGKHKPAAVLHKQALEHGVKPGEPALSNLIKAATSAGDIPMAEQYLKDMKSAGFLPRTRSYSPLIAAYTEQGRPESCMELYREMNSRGVVLTPTDYVNVVRCLSAGGQAVIAQDVLQHMANSIHTLGEERLAALSAAIPLWGNWNPQTRQAGSGTWTTKRVHVDKRGQVAGVGTYLRSVELSPDETKTLAKQTRDLACTSPHRVTQFVQFEKFLAAFGNIDVIVDGANVGYMNQNHAQGAFSHHQIDLVVNHFLSRKKKVLLVLHKRWVRTDTDLKSSLHVKHKKSRSRAPPSPEKQAKIGAIVQSWRDKGVLFVMPPGNNDDLYWLHAAVLKGPRTFVISNDQMRDHCFGMLAPRAFFNWRERHQVKFYFKNSRSEERMSPGFRFPPPFSRRIHASDSKTAWYFAPSASTTDEAEAKTGDGEWLAAWYTDKSLFSESDLAPPGSKSGRRQVKTAKAGAGAGDGTGAGAGAGAGAGSDPGAGASAGSESATATAASSQELASTTRALVLSALDRTDRPEYAQFCGLLKAAVAMFEAS